MVTNGTSGPAGLASVALSRRGFITLAGGVVGAFALSACAPDPAPSGDGTGTTSPSEPFEFTALYFEGAGQDVVPARLLEEFGKAHPNATVKSVIGASRYPEVIAAFKANGTALTNFGIFTAGVMAQGAELGMFEKVDAGALGITGINSSYDLFPGQGIPFNSNLIGLVYNPEMMDAPTSWLDLLDPKNRGLVGLFDAPQGLLFSGLWAVNQALGGDEETLDEGFKAFSEAARAGQFGTLYNSNQTQFDAFSRKEVALASSILATQNAWKSQGASIEYAVPTEGQMAVPLFLGTVKGSSAAQIDASAELITRMLEPENIREYNDLTFAAPVIDGAELPDAHKSLPAFGADALAKVQQVDWALHAKVQAQLVERWNRDVKGQLA